ASPDQNYPYLSGAMSTTPLFESLLDAVQSPVGTADVMGYCNGDWFSDYNFREVQRFLESQPQPAKIQITSAAGPTESLIITGRIDADGVTINPVQRTRGIAQTAAGGAGSHTLRLILPAGDAISIDFEPVQVDHASESHFFVQIPAPAALAGIAVARGGAL